METSQFEAVKVGIKQDNSGYILTLRIHPDGVELPLWIQCSAVLVWQC